jgi:2,3,4,5-tetrahydropyridine-2,6-dicarboxylate N-succinyltransferase
MAVLAYQSIIEKAYESRDNIHANMADNSLKTTINEILNDLESGSLRVAEYRQNTWHINEWVKKAILLYFKLHNSEVIEGGFSQFYDKIPLRFENATKETFSYLETRIVPPATIRRGAYLGPKTVIMPSFVNIGAYVGAGTLVDTWATVGSCAQIGNNVHLSGGVGIGGVLEPLQASPTIIEDNCFIGARSEIVEGVIVEKGAVISMGVYIGQSTRIFNRETGEISYGRIPSNSVVVPGTLPSSDGKCQLYCAVIVKQVDDKTRAKTAINDLLRF